MSRLNFLTRRSKSPLPAVRATHCNLRRIQNIHESKWPLTLDHKPEPMKSQFSKICTCIMTYTYKTRYTSMSDVIYMWGLLHMYEPSHITCQTSLWKRALQKFGKQEKTAAQCRRLGIGKNNALQTRPTSWWKCYPGTPRRRAWKHLRWDSRSVGVGVYVYVCVWVGEWVGLCVCTCERIQAGERERWCVYVCVCVCVCVYARARECVRVCDRGRECMWVCVFVRVFHVCAFPHYTFVHVFNILEFKTHADSTPARCVAVRCIINLGVHFCSCAYEIGYIHAHSRINTK